MNDHTLTIETLAEVLCASRYRSRRQAKRLLHDAGLTHCTGVQLDEVLTMIRERDDYDDIQSLAEAMQAAMMEANRKHKEQNDELPEWLIGETPEYGRTFIIHNCKGGAWSFCGEVFDNYKQSDVEAYPLDGVQMLANITWLDDRPPIERVQQLMSYARRQLRIYDQWQKN